MSKEKGVNGRLSHGGDSVYDTWKYRSISVDGRVKVLAGLPLFVSMVLSMSFYFAQSRRKRGGVRALLSVGLCAASNVRAGQFFKLRAYLSGDRILIPLVYTINIYVYGT